MTDDYDSIMPDRINTPFAAARCWTSKHASKLVYIKLSMLLQSTHENDTIFSLFRRHYQYPSYTHIQSQKRLLRSYKVERDLYNS